MLRTIQSAARQHRMTTRSTFLVHAVPEGRTSAEVAADVVHNQLPRLAAMIAQGELAPVDFIDVFWCAAPFGPPSR